MEMKSGVTDLAWILGRTRPFLGLICVGILASTCAGAIATVDPLLVRHWIDVTLPRRELAPSVGMVVLISLCFAGRYAINGLGGLCGFRASQRIGQDLRNDLVWHMTSLSMEWHERTLVGEKLSRIEQDIDQIGQFAADALSTILRAVIFFAMNLSIMFALNWRMSLTVVPLLPLFLWVRARYRSTIETRARESQTATGRSSGVLTEHLGGIPQIQMLGAEALTVSRTIGVRDQLMSAQWAQRRSEIGFSVAVTSIMAVAILFLLGVGTHEYLVGSVTIGSLVAFYAYATRIFEPVSTALELYARSRRMMASCRRVREVLKTRPAVEDKGKLDPADSPLPPCVAGKDVRFAYSTRAEAVRGISFSIAAGERVAVIGRSGSGKSSLARLLARMSDPTNGCVALNGTPLPEYSLQRLRNTICCVPQSPVLFSGTVRENLLLARPQATTHQLLRALEIAQMQGVLDRLPLGLETPLGPDAAGLSGGERQRLALARALLRSCPVLILDEATSALDVVTERAVLQSIADTTDAQTIIVISHRLRSLNWMDRFILLDAGTIIAQGNHAEMYRGSALYRELYEAEDDEGNEKQVAAGDQLLQS